MSLVEYILKPSVCPSESQFGKLLVGPEENVIEQRISGCPTENLF